MNKAFDTYHLILYKNGENQPIGLFYDFYATKLLMVAYKYLQNTQEAKDVVMDVFEKLIHLNNEKRKTIVPDSIDGFTAWLITITKNYCFDILKHKNVVAQYQSALVNVEPLTQPDADRIWDKQTIDNVINKLQGSEKEVASMHYSGYSHDEIAGKLKVSYNTVRNQLSSAKKKIRKYISTPLVVLLLNQLN